MWLVVIVLDNAALEHSLTLIRFEEGNIPNCICLKFRNIPNSISSAHNFRQPSLIVVVDVFDVVVVVDVDVAAVELF